MNLRPNRASVLAGFALALTGCVSAPSVLQREAVDLLITGGEVYDGSGEQLAGVEIAIRDGVIVEVAQGLELRVEAKRRIDAEGLIVTPGFIDPHTHADSDLLAEDSLRRANLPFALQGVTTVMVGNDGYGLSEPREGKPIRSTGTNFAFLSGFGDLRRAVTGMEDRAANDREQARMIDLLRRDFCAGAFGFSAGLYYAPQSFAETGEVISLAREAGAMGGYYDTHMRDESDFSIGLLAALDEAIEIGRSGALPVHIAHIKALGPAVWGESGAMIARIETARKAGLRVTADQYPWSASGTRISSALVPRWALDGGLDTLRQRISDPEVKAQVANGIAGNIARRGGPQSLLITGALDVNPAIEGKTLAELAQDQGIAAEHVALSILAEGDARLASFNMSEGDIAAFAAQEWVMTGSDGSGGHPRKYASFPKAYDDWVRKGDFDIGWFVRRSSGLPAATIGLTDRGFLRQGYAADLVIFDPASFAPQATYSEPEILSQGVEWLVVNGQLVIEDGVYQGAMPGKMLKKTQPASICPAINTEPEN